MTDWGDGEYERSAQTLMPAAENVIVQADVQAGAKLLDVACGTGNALLLAAGLGADVTGVDLAPRLVEVTRERLGQAELPGEVVVGDATELPFGDDAFDIVVSVFGVIFAPAEAAAAELRRVTRPGGRILVTSWQPGLIGRVGMEVMNRLELPPPPAGARRWGDRDDLAALLPGARITTHEIAFTAASPQAWWHDQTAHHPLFRDARRELEPKGRWEDLDRAVLELLAEGNEDPSAFRSTSKYWLAEARVGG